MKKLRYMTEAAALYLAYGLFKILPPAAASNLGGWLARTIGPKLAASRKARQNINAALPGQHTDKILYDMWDNLGRVMAEYPHLEKIAPSVELVGSEHLKTPGTAVYFGAHLANWELLPSSFFLQENIYTRSLYRAPNNPWADKLLHNCRTLNGRLGTIPKSRSGTRQWMDAMKQGDKIALLIDQKYNEGITADFFGMPAKTGTAFIQMAKKFNCPLHPMRCERLEATRFRITIYPALTIENRADEDILSEAHRHLESWIRERPGQWLWLHRRWVMNEIKTEENDE